MLKNIIISSSLFMFIAGCSITTDAEKFAKENPGDVYGILAKAEAGDKDVSCNDLRQSSKVANTLASKKGATVTELSLPGRYQGVLKRYGC